VESVHRVLRVKEYRGRAPSSRHVTMNFPVICVGWTSHRKKYVPGVLGAVKVYFVVPGPVTIAPLKMDLLAEASVYRAKLCGTPDSLLVKVIVTADPAGTVIVLLSNCMFCAVRVMAAAWPAPLGVVCTAVVPFAGVIVALVEGVLAHPARSVLQSNRLATAITRMYLRMRGGRRGNYKRFVEKRPFVS
jgi:hypothetical protein